MGTLLANLDLHRGDLVEILKAVQEQEKQKLKLVNCCFTPHLCCI